MKNKINNQSGFVLIEFIGQLISLYFFIYIIGTVFKIGFFDKQIFVWLAIGCAVIFAIIMALVWLPVIFEKIFKKKK